jgi:hypothetical protein
MGTGDRERMGGPHPDPDGVDMGPWDEAARRNVDREVMERVLDEVDEELAQEESERC